MIAVWIYFVIYSFLVPTVLFYYCLYVAKGTSFDSRLLSVWFVIAVNRENWLWWQMYNWSWEFFPDFSSKGQFVSMTHKRLCSFRMLLTITWNSCSHFLCGEHAGKLKIGLGSDGRCWVERVVKSLLVCVDVREPARRTIHWFAWLWHAVKWTWSRSNRSSSVSSAPPSTPWLRSLYSTQ